MPEGVAEWKSRAEQLIACDVNSKTSNLAQNMLITQAYAKMYLAKPTVFKWTGMAAFASDMVGLGIAAGKTIDVMIDLQIKTGAVEAYSYGQVFWVGLPATDLQRRINVTDLDNLLVEGNKAVFRDIYWQHLAYQQKGLANLLTLLATLPSGGRDTLSAGWQEIDAGAKSGDQSRVWRGNELLLRFEQEFTLQRVYDRYPGVANALSYTLISPLPGHWAPFQVHFSGGSVAVFKSRWAWITEHLVPHWKRLDASSIPTRVRVLVMGRTPKPVICLLD